MCHGDVRECKCEAPEAPRVPRPDLKRPLSTEETAGFAVGDPFKEHGLPEDFTKVIANGLARPDRHENAAGKKFCGICVYKTPIKGEWRCTNQKGTHFGPDGGMGYPCPALQSVFGQHISCPGFFPKPSKSPPPQPKKKALPVPEGVRFLYIGRPHNPNPTTPAMKALKRAFGPHLQRVFGPPTKSQGVVTVAWITPAPGVLHLGFSFCSPEDPWCKATGRDMALARLLTSYIPIRYLYNARMRVHEVARAVLNHDFEILEALVPGAKAWGHSRVPGWTKALAKRMKERERMVGGRIRRLRVPPTHAADAVTYLLAGLYPPGGIRPKPTPQQIVARMMRDIAALGND